MERQIKKLKKKKTGKDKIKNEAWLYCTGKARFKLLEIIQRVWKGDGFPRSQRKGQIVPIYKKGDKDKAINYRGITLLSTAYKIYAMILQERLEKEVEEKKNFTRNTSGIQEKGRRKEEKRAMVLE